MLDFFSIFSKGGILLWCFKGIGLDEKDWAAFTPAVNAFIKTVLLQVRSTTLFFLVFLALITNLFDWCRKKLTKKASTKMVLWRSSTSWTTNLS